MRPWAEFLDRLARLGRVIVFDKRGTGMSDRRVGIPDIEQRTDDIRAVMDGAGSERGGAPGRAITSRPTTVAVTPRVRESEAHLVRRPCGDSECFDEFRDVSRPATSALDHRALDDLYTAGAGAESFGALTRWITGSNPSGAAGDQDSCLVGYREKEPTRFTYGSRVVAELIPAAVLVRCPARVAFRSGG